MTDTATEPPRTSALAPAQWYDRLAAIARDNPFLFVLVALVAVVMALLSPALLVGDSWMTLIAGRDVADHGIPDRETLTIMASGARWIDQQWLGQLVVYGVEQAGGLAGLGVLAGVVIAGTYASSIAAAR